MGDGRNWRWGRRDRKRDEIERSAGEEGREKETNTLRTKTRGRRRSERTRQKDRVLWGGRERQRD